MESDYKSSWDQNQLFLKQTFASAAPAKLSQTKPEGGSHKCVVERLKNWRDLSMNACFFNCGLTVQK